MKNSRTKLSYTLYILLVAFVFCGCKEHEQKQKQKQRRQEVGEWQTVEYDGCEYVIGFRKMAHKGNCKYCIERSKK